MRDFKNAKVFLLRDLRNLSGGVVFIISLYLRIFSLNLPVTRVSFNLPNTELLNIHTLYMLLDLVYATVQNFHWAVSKIR